MDLHLTGKRAFVSGSTRGIGYAIAQALLVEGEHSCRHGALRAHQGRDACSEQRPGQAHAGDRRHCEHHLGGPAYSDGVAETVIAIARAQGMAPEDLKAAIIGRNQTSLLQRFIDPTEIAQLALYLASPLSAASNGAAVRADGGVLPSMI